MLRSFASVEISGLTQPGLAFRHDGTHIPPGRSDQGTALARAAVQVLGSSAGSEKSEPVRSPPWTTALLLKLTFVDVSWCPFTFNPRLGHAPWAINVRPWFRAAPKASKGDAEH